MTKIRKSKSGWICELDGYSEGYGALIQGAYRGRRLLLPYSVAPFGYGAETRLGERHNELYTVGEILQLVIPEHEASRVLRRGYRVGR